MIIPLKLTVPVLIMKTLLIWGELPVTENISLTFLPMMGVFKQRLNLKSISLMWQRLLFSLLMRTQSIFERTQGFLLILIHGIRKMGTVTQDLQRAIRIKQQRLLPGQW